MATLILGGIGAVVGSAFGAPWLGFSIGSSLGGMIDASNRPGTHTDQGRLADLRISSSSYGTNIPQAWGATRLPGIIVFATDLQEQSQTINSGGGGKGAGSGPSTTQYWYTCTFLVLFNQSTMLMPDGTLVNRYGPNSLQRLWFDDLLVYDTITPTNISTTVDLNNNTVSAAADLTFYPGLESQTVDSTIANWVAAHSSEYTQGLSPAYRGWTTVVCRNVNLQPYGNRVPNVSAELLSGAVSVADVCTDIAGQVKVPLTALDMSQATGTPVLGYYVNQQTAGSDAIHPVAQMYFFDIPEVDGVLRAVARGGAITRTISFDDMNTIVVEPGSGGGTVQAGSARVSETYTQVVDLPSRLDLTYYSHTTDPNMDRHFEQATQGDQRQSALTNNPQSLSVALTLDDSTARQMAAQLLDIAWLERKQFKFSLPPKYMALACADCVYLPVGANSYRVRIISIELGVSGQMNISAVFDDSSNTQQSIVGGTNGGIPTGPVIAGASLFTVFSGKELRDLDQSAPGFYVAANGPGNIYYSPDNGTTWLSVGPVSGLGTFGSATSVLANGATAGAFDTINTVNINLVAGTLASTSQTAVQNGQNIAVLGNEILGVATVGLLSPGNFALSNIERGLRGSSMIGHASAQKFILVSAANTVRISVAKSLIGQTVQVKVVGSNGTLSGTTAQNVVISTPTVSTIQQQIAAGISPWYRTRFKINSFNDSGGTIVPGSADFASGYIAGSYYSSGPDGSVRFSDPGLAISFQFRLGLTNTTTTAIPVAYTVPAVDNGAQGIFAGTQLFQVLSSSLGAGASGTFSIPANSSGILELYYYNENKSASYDPSNEASFSFFTNALLQTGLTWYDAGV